MKVDIYSIRSFDSFFNGGEIFCVVIMTLGGGRAIITLQAVLIEIVVGDATVRDRGR